MVGAAVRLLRGVYLYLYLVCACSGYFEGLHETANAEGIDTTRKPGLPWFPSLLELSSSSSSLRWTWRTSCHTAYQRVAAAMM